jgi:hypothetical protein
LGWFCSALGAEGIPGSAAERAALYRSLLTDRRVLVVLDNALDSLKVEDLLTRGMRDTSVNSTDPEIRRFLRR